MRLAIWTRARENDSTHRSASSMEWKLELDFNNGYKKKTVLAYANRAPIGKIVSITKRLGETQLWAHRMRVKEKAIDKQSDMPIFCLHFIIIVIITTIITIMCITIAIFLTLPLIKENRTEASWCHRYCWRRPLKAFADIYKLSKWRRCDGRSGNQTRILCAKGWKSD